jgi:hypothetical protein
MSLAKLGFLESLNLLESTLEAPIVQDRAPKWKVHNGRARVVRNGVAVVSFSVLEEFIKARMGEILVDISASGVPFNDLPEDLQEAVTYGAIASIAYSSKQIDKSGKSHITFVQHEAASIASTQAFPYAISPKAIGWDKANLGKEDVKGFMEKLKISGGWQTLREISVRVNHTLPNPAESFANAARRRHRAAHAPNTSTPFSDLVSFLTEARVIGFAYDCMLTHAKRLIERRDTEFMKKNTTIDQTGVLFRFIEQRGKFWSECKVPGGSVVRKSGTRNVATASAIPRVRKNKEILVVVNSTGHIVDWQVAY